MWRELRHAGAEAAADAVVADKTLRQAIMQIVVADVSMSLDNVLAITGAARGEPALLVVGLVLSVALMGLAANFIAKLLGRYRAIGYVGLAIIVWVALTMIWQGVAELLPLLSK